MTNNVTVEEHIYSVTVEGTEISVVSVGTQGPQGVTGPQGDPGPQGPAGTQGEPGEGVPVGGLTGQVLTKVDGTDYNTEWSDVTPSISWGDIGGTLSTQTDLTTALSGKADTSHTHTKSQITDFNDGDYATAAQGALANSAVQPGDNVSSLLNDAGYLTSFTETDPVFSSSVASGISSSDVTNWNTAFSWGDHSTQGYLTNITSESFIDLSDTPATFTADKWIKVNALGTGLEWVDAPVASVSWGDIGGTLSTQTDLATALSGKADTAHTHVMADITDATWISDYSVTQSDVTQHQAALSITESQISDLGNYLVDITSESIKDLSDVSSTSSPVTGQVLTWSGAQWYPATPTASGGSTTAILQPVKMATVDNITDVTAIGSGIGKTLEINKTALTIDGLSPTVGDRILVKNQTNSVDNGIYLMSQDYQLGVEEVSQLTVNSSGSDPAWQGTYVTLEHPTHGKRYIWFSTAPGQTDPEPAGYFELNLAGEISISSTDTPADIAQKIAAKIGSNTHFDVTQSNNVVTITNNRVDLGIGAVEDTAVHLSNPSVVLLAATTVTQGADTKLITLTRTSDFDETTDFTKGSLVMVQEGSTNSMTMWSVSSNTTTIDTDAITFTPAGGGADPSLQEQIDEAIALAIVL